MKVILTPLALRKVRRLIARMREHRPGSEEVFQQEFEHVTHRLVTMTSRGPVGTIYDEICGRTIRRVLMPRTQQHLYYLINEDTDTVFIRTIWGARRERGPRF